MHRKEALPEELDVTPATDILWTLNHPDLWQLLVGERGWKPDEYEQWFGDTICSQLLRDRRTTKGRLEAALRRRVMRAI